MVIMSCATVWLSSTWRVFTEPSNMRTRRCRCFFLYWRRSCGGRRQQGQGAASEWVSDSGSSEWNRKQQILSSDVSIKPCATHTQHVWYQFGCFYRRNNSFIAKMTPVKPQLSCSSFTLLKHWNIEIGMGGLSFKPTQRIKYNWFT